MVDADRREMGDEMDFEIGPSSPRAQIRMCMDRQNRGWWCDNDHPMIP